MLWQRPEEADKISEFLMSQLAADDGLQQANYLFSGTHSAASIKNFFGGMLLSLALCRQEPLTEEVESKEIEVNFLKGLALLSTCQESDV